MLSLCGFNVLMVIIVPWLMILMLCQCMLEIQILVVFICMRPEINEFLHESLFIEVAPAIIKYVIEQHCTITFARWDEFQVKDGFNKFVVKLTEKNMLM